MARINETPWTKKLLIYDLRTNQHFTLKTNPLKREHLDEFVALYNPANRHNRKPTWSAQADAASGAGPEGRWQAYEYAELICPRQGQPGHFLAERRRPD